MKKNILLCAFFTFALLFSNETTAQKFPDLDKSPADIALYKTKADGVIAKIVYSRPQLKGRSVSKLAPAGKVWRMGANESTEIRFFKDVNFGGKSVKAGTYSMFAIPGATEWTLILNKTTNEWGSFGYKESEDVVRVQAPVSSSKTSVEALGMMFSKTGDLLIGWDTTVVTVSIK